MSEPQTRPVSLRREGRDEQRGERGTATLYLTIAATAMVVFAGLVVDGGRALAVRAQAASAARQAARAGADALAPASLRAASPQDLAIDSSAADQAAQRVLAAAGATGQVSVSGVDVTVTANIPAQATILTVVGIGDLSATATGTATILYGTTTAGP